MQSVRMSVHPSILSHNITHKAPPKFAADNNFKFCCFFKNNK